MISDKVFNETVRLLLSNIVSLHSQVITLELALTKNGILQEAQIEAVREQRSAVLENLQRIAQTFDATADPSRIEAIFQDIEGTVQ
jgi:hypothetical protein